MMEEIEPIHIQRIRAELQLLSEKGIQAELVRGNQDFVLYRSIETSGKALILPERTDVLVPVPAGYPASMIDMPALPKDSPLITRVIGSNIQGEHLVNGILWGLCSYHPYNGGGGPPWNPMMHGFHDYYNHIYFWLNKLK